MESGTRFEILGQLRVRTGEVEVTVTGREQVLLATLLLHANQPVGTERLVDAIWGDAPPREARNRLQGCVSRLRKRLTAAGLPGRTVVTDPAGYRIDVAGGTVDLHQFRQQVAEARAAVEQGHPRAARDAYRAALALWRGPALAGIDSDLVRKVAAALDEEQVRAAEERIQVELDLGAAGELVPELTDLVTQHPYRENLHAALMTALHRAGRQADALAAYQRVRALLIDEVGTEPGTELRELHQRVLAHDPALLAPLPATRDDAPHSLPRAIADFTGRGDAVARLLRLARPGSGALPVVAIDGMAGSGKTALAVHAAHLLAPHYPDAQLYLDLHGHSERRPVEPAAALEALLRQLGVPGSRIPPEAAERETLWRSELAGRRAIVVLDNAAGAAQVGPLLPAGEGCLVLVTSRRRLTGLDAVRPLSLDPLTSEEAVVLLAQVAGDRVWGEPEVAAEVARRCGHLPLALRLAGTRLAHRPAWRVRDLAERLRDARGLLTELAAEDRTVADAFALSYAPLPPELRRAFRLLGLHPGDELDRLAVAALVDLDSSGARRVLDELVDRHLVAEVAPGRYRMHDLVREYAHQLASATDPEPERTAALARLSDFYLYATAAITVSPDRPSDRALQLRQPERPDLVAEVAADPTWLQREWPDLVAAVRQAGAAGLDRYAWRLALVNWRFLYERHHVADLIATHRQGLASAERLGDPAAVASMLNYLASGHFLAGDLDAAVALLQRALTLRQRSGDTAGEATTLMNLGIVSDRRGQLWEAVELYERALAIKQRLGNVQSTGTALANLGNAYNALGRCQEALRCFQRSLAVARGPAAESDRQQALGNLGAVRFRMGRYDAAVRLLEIAVRLARQDGRRSDEVEFRSLLGAAYRELGRYTVAMERHREALAVGRETGNRPLECMARNELGVTLRVSGDVDGALEQHRTVLAAASPTELAYAHARALDGIACCLAATDPDAARQHWERALRLYREMGVPERNDVEHRLATLLTPSPAAGGAAGPGPAGRLGGNP